MFEFLGLGAGGAAGAAAGGVTTSTAIGLALSGAGVALTAFALATETSSQEICACLNVVNNTLREIAATLKDGFSGRNVDVGGINRRLSKAQIEKLGFGLGASDAEKRLAKFQTNLGGFKASDLGFTFVELERILKEDLELQKAGELSRKSLIEALKDTRSFLEKEAGPGIGGFDPAALTELNKLLGELTATIGAEDGLLGALAGLAEAVEIAASRIAAAVNAPAPTGGGVPKKASGGTVTAGQPVLVGERGPEIFIPGSAGSIVNAFDAAAGEGTGLGMGGTAGASSQTAVEREIIATLKELDATLADLDESIRQAEDAGILGSSGRSSSSRGFATRGSAKDPLAQIDEALRLVESTGGAFEDMGRVLEQLKRQGEDSFKGIALAADEARGVSDMPGGASNDRLDARAIARNDCDDCEDWKLAA